LAAIWLADKRVEPGVYPPEQAFHPEDFFADLDKFGIPTQVTVKEML